MAHLSDRTHATDMFKALSPEHVMKQKYSTRLLFNHALKVFLMSYPELDTQRLTDQLYLTKLQEYTRVIEDLYGRTMNDLTHLNAIWTELQTAKLAVIFAAKRFTGRNMGQDFSLVVNSAVTGDFLAQTPLDAGSEVQENNIAFFECSFSDVRVLRQQNYLFNVSVRANQWNPSVAQSVLNNLTIGMTQIHPEGYQQWFDFGRGVRLLIEITYIESPSTAANREHLNFHLHTIYRMIDRLLVRHRTERRGLLWHKHEIRSLHISFQRPAVAPQTDEMFWRTTHQNWMERRRESIETGVELTIKEAIATKVNYLDIQRSFVYGEDTEGTVCLCNEWCNWNAFFHYNPIYRFIIVQNSQLFLKNTCLNVPEMYLFASIVQTISNNDNKGLVLPLMTSANENRKKFSSKYLCDRVIYQTYTLNVPNPFLMNGIVYNVLRYNTNITELCHQLDDNPLADICVKNLIDYYKLLSDLHYICSLCANFISYADRHRWMKEMDEISRRAVGKFFIRSYSLFFHSMTISAPTEEGQPIEVITRDRVFGWDVEYLNYVPKTEDQSRIKYMRTKALRWVFADGDSGNVLNMTVILSGFLNCFIQVYKFFAQIDSKLPSVYYRRANQDINDYCAKFDKDFRIWFDPDQQQKFTVSTQDLNTSGLTEDKHQWVYAFYTLKLYSFGFCIQKHCINGRGDLLDFLFYERSLTQIADFFDFIFDNTVIEETYRHISGQILFDIPNNCQTLFDDFYQNFWGTPDHEVMQYNDNYEAMAAAFQQYRKLYVWLKNDGNHKKKFTAIIRQFGRDLRQIDDRSEKLMRDIVLPAMGWLHKDKGYEYSVEVMDVLALYLVRASCFCVLRVVSDFFKGMHSLQVEYICDEWLSFSMGKPGWALLLKTMDKVLSTLDRLRVLYIQFDDEIERISESLIQTQRLTKQFYKSMYNKLSIEWLREIGEFIEKTDHQSLSPQDIKGCDQTMAIQVMFGLSFSADFVDSYRIWFHSCRIFLWNLYHGLKKAKLQYVMLMDSRVPANRYLKGRNYSKRTDKPFETQRWTQFLSQHMPDLSNLNPTDVGLDMSAADVEITPQVTN